MTPDEINKTIEYMHAHLATVTVGDCAALVHYSKYHYSRCFSEFIGMAPGAYITEVRYVQAAGLLANGCPLVKVLSEVGFRSRTSFDIGFRTRYGMTPYVYRKWQMTVNSFNLTFKG